MAGLMATFGPRAPEQHHVSISARAGPTPARATLRELLGSLFTSVRGRAAIGALISGQLVMVLIMTMTPYHLNHTGHADATIGLVISAHTLGMFALSPISGRLAERFGAPNVILAGFGTLALAGVLGAATPASSGTVLMVPLFLLGFGWNMTFVAGSSMLASGDSYADRARLQGVVDASVWGTAALAGISAGFVVQLAGYAVLCGAGATLSVLLASAIVLDRRTARPAEG
jgi:MFS family permease